MPGHKYNQERREQNSHVTPQLTAAADPLLGRPGGNRWKPPSWPPWALGCSEPWAAMGPGLQWALGCSGPWAAVGPGLQWALGCSGPWAAVGPELQQALGCCRATCPIWIVCSAGGNCVLRLLYRGQCTSYYNDVYSWKYHIHEWNMNGGKELFVYALS